MNLILDEDKSEDIDDENDKKDKKTSIIVRIRKNIEKNQIKIHKDCTSEASFDLSKSSDVDGLCENLEKKSNPSINYEYESTLQNEEEDLNKEINLYFNNMAKKEPGIDPKIKLISSNLYKDIIGGKIQNLDKTNMGYTKYASISGPMDEQTIRLKNDLSGEPIENTDNVYILKGKFSKQSSLKNEITKLEYKKTMSLEYSKERESEKKDLISLSSQNKQSLNKVGTKNSKNT